jgi:CDP-2,3-bis-(O-geranylgeranyl)-sn-glycerol synthase
LPIDGGATLADGSRVLGDHKTWVGLIAAIVACGAVGELAARQPLLGATFALLSMTGDCASSCFKRRLHMKPGREIPAVDQLPEALLPLIVLARPLRLHALAIVAIALIFLVLEWATVKLRHPI